MHKTMPNQFVFAFEPFSSNTSMASRDWTEMRPLLGVHIRVRTVSFDLSVPTKHPSEHQANTTYLRRY